MTSKEEKWRREGMAYALRVAKEQGIDYLERDLKLRGATQCPIGVPKGTIDDCVKRIKECTLDTVLILALVTLHDEFGFGEKRCQQFMKRFDSKTECLCGDFADWKDMQQILADECNIHIEIRTND